jgi:hypothetical protein
VHCAAAAAPRSALRDTRGNTRGASASFSVLWWCAALATADTQHLPSQHTGSQPIADGTLSEFRPRRQHGGELELSSQGCGLVGISVGSHVFTIEVNRDVQYVCILKEELCETQTEKNTNKG